MQVTSNHQNSKGSFINPNNAILSRLEVNKKSAFLIVHTTQSKALQIPNLHHEVKEVEAEFAAINDNNSKQLWIIDEREPNLVELVSGFTDKVLTADDKNILIKKGAGRKNQLWVLEEVNGHYRIRSAAETSLGLSYDPIAKKPTLKRNAQDEWEFRKVKDNQLLNKTCFIFCPFSQKMIDVPESSRKEGEFIGVWTPNYRFNQRWRIYKAGDVYIIKSYINDLNLDVYEEKFEEGTRICQYQSHGNINQLWMLEKLENNNDSYRIYCFADPQYELGHDGKRLRLKKGRHTVWRIEGYIPE